MPKKTKPDSNLIWIIILFLLALFLVLYYQNTQQENFVGESHSYLRRCRDECPNGARVCDGRLGYRYCGRFYDSDNCTEWSPIKYCRSGYICMGQMPTARCGPIPSSAYT